LKDEEKKDKGIKDGIFCGHYEEEKLDSLWTDFRNNKHLMRVFTNESLTKRIIERRAEEIQRSNEIQPLLTLIRYKKSVFGALEEDRQIKLKRPNIYFRKFRDLDEKKREIMESNTNFRLYRKDDSNEVD
jgi:hypothetical protein